MILNLACRMGLKGRYKLAHLEPIRRFIRWMILSILFGMLVGGRKLSDILTL
jgi:hypothetical protein